MYWKLKYTVEVGIYRLKKSTLNITQVCTTLLYNMVILLIMIMMAATVI